jgi:hypothetical protein
MGFILSDFGKLRAQGEPGSQNLKHNESAESAHGEVIFNFTRPVRRAENSRQQAKAQHSKTRSTKISVEARHPKNKFKFQWWIGISKVRTSRPS